MLFSREETYDGEWWCWEWYSSFDEQNRDGKSWIETWQCEHKAGTFGKELSLEKTSSDHYSIPLNEVTVSLEQCAFTDCKSIDDKK